MFVALALHVGVTIAGKVATLFPVLFGDFVAEPWPGQFNVDFIVLLTLSTILSAWRRRLSPVGFTLARTAFSLGHRIYSPSHCRQRRGEG